MKKCLIIALLPAVLLLLSSCVTSHVFLMTRLSDVEKSEAICAKGKKIYQKTLVNERKFDEIPRVRKFFSAALEFNPNNSEAAKYLKLVDTFRTAYVTRYLARARKYQKKKKRTEQDVFNMLYYIQKSQELDTKNEKVKAFKKEVKNDYDRMIGKYLEKGKDLDDRFAAEKNVSAADDLAVSALNVYVKLVLLDPSRKTPQVRKAKYEKYIQGRFKKVMADTEKKLKTHQYTKSKGNIAQMKRFAVTARHKAAVKDTEYRLYYNWALFRYNQKNYRGALECVNKALKVQSRKKGLSLKNRINLKLKDIRINKEFDKLLDEIRAQVDKGRLIDARDRIREVIDEVPDAAKRKKLNALIAKIDGKMPDFVDKIYQSALKDYQDDNYDSAIEKLEKVLELEGNYKEAQSYLIKARDKKDLMETF